jgi:hypothetical protein
MIASQRKRKLTWKAKVARIQQAPPSNVAANMLNLAIGIHYWQTLLKNARVVRYLKKYHQKDLREVERWLAECARKHSRLQKAHPESDTASTTGRLFHQSFR